MDNQFNPQIIEGKFDASGKSFGIAVARWNEFIVGKLVAGALDALRRHNADAANITIAYCPGSFEIPLVVQKLAQSGKFDAVIALGAVIRGSTPHFDYISSEVTKGVASVGLETGVPCIFGVLTTDTIEQAVERAGTKAGNKGFEAAVSAIEMVSLFDSFKNDAVKKRK
ncbi:MAG: 6,7-dimethyl-8-ribityllumazine synthase [Bacteroidota bacterium]